jgi:hypothetical protein
VPAEPKALLYIGEQFTTPSGTCVVRHTKALAAETGLGPNGYTMAPAAAVVRCVGHLADGPDTKTTLVITLSDGWYDTRFGTYSWSTGSYVG